MKTTNLTRLEARQEMLLGAKVGQVGFGDSGAFYFFDGKSFVLSSVTGCKSNASMSAEDGYFIYEPEPTFKEVVMYQAVLPEASHEREKPCKIFSQLFKTKKEAIGIYPSIGYTEVKVFFKTSEGKDE